MESRPVVLPTEASQRCWRLSCVGYHEVMLKSKPKPAPAGAQDSATFAERLRDLREKSGLHSYDIAEKMGVRLSAYLALEGGKCQPTFADPSMSDVHGGKRPASPFLFVKVRWGDRIQTRHRGRPSFEGAAFFLSRGGRYNRSLGSMS